MSTSRTTKKATKKVAKKVAKKTTKKVVKKASTRKRTTKLKAVDYPNDQRTKYVQDVHDEQVHKLCLLGAIDKELCDFFDIAESTLNLWKKDHKSFGDALRAGKLLADANVAESLYKRATGLALPEDVILSDKGEHTDTVRRLKHFPPDTAAAIFWLKNRDRARWRDKQEVEATGDLADAFRKMAEGLPD